MKFCSECRAGNPDDAPQCRACDHDLAGPPRDAQADIPTNAPPREQEPEAPGLAEGRRVGPDGRYEIHEKLGKGGMGVVYRATDHHLGEVVAIKSLLPRLVGSESARKRFLNEARIARALRHENIVTVYGADVHEGLTLLVMELLQGRTLRHVLKALAQRNERMPLPQVVEVLTQACRALEHAHETTLHLDIKPENIFLTQAPRGGVRVKLLDFGIARGVDRGFWATSNFAAGTAGYMAPEVLDWKSPTVSSDVYSLGAVLYECLTGRKPVGIVAMPSTFRDDLGPEWDALVSEALSPDPSKRPPTVSAFRRRLEAAASPPEPAMAEEPAPLPAREPEPASAPEPAPIPPAPRRRPTPWILAGASLLVAALVVAWALRRGGDDGAEAMPAPPPATAPSLPTGALPEGLRRAERNAQGFDVFVRDRDGARVVKLEGGAFLMGSDRADEKPPHQVELTPFLMDERETTWAQYERFASATGRARPPRPAWNPPADHPVVNVTWDDAAGYCAWAGGRLPTEAEWEYAARGRANDVYPWGNAWSPSKLNAGGTSDGFERTAPAGRFRTGASPWGLLDMSGNAWEWCADWYDATYYSISPPRDPKGPAAGELRVLRGCSFYKDGPQECRATKRNGFDPAKADVLNGFRCAMDLR